MIGTDTSFTMPGIQLGLYGNQYAALVLLNRLCHFVSFLKHTLEYNLICFLTGSLVHSDLSDSAVLSGRTIRTSGQQHPRRGDRKSSQSRLQALREE
jgi:hypothetical protein